ncbi:MAG TPA: HupE/UreJ family protein [Tepidisphaeraceae bacterium]|nr:HupE/UreJ family protein [Tepidisphaeraceae bacterium]
MIRRSVFILSLILLTQVASAHDLLLGYLELRQTGPETFAMLWTLPAKDELRGLHPDLPADCKTDPEPQRMQTADSFIERTIITCPGGLDGKTISLDPKWAAMLDVLVRVVRPDESTQVYRLTPVTDSFIVEAAPGWVQKAGTFLVQGIEHILMGIDHLLFVLGLLLIVDSRWMLAKTITSFTIAHSITLALAALTYTAAPALPLNAAIALSILFLGPEIIRKQRGQSSLTIRHPWVVAFAFGLLHGVGFASGLTSLGLSRHEIPLALLMFNVGVEIGQLFFVFIIIGLEHGFRKLEIYWPYWVQQIPVYVVGGLGAYWTIQRTLIMMGYT